jgi:hypothetical protein
MKHIKEFKALNESKEDGLEIMDALLNTPEGKDLVSLICIRHKTFSDSFEMKRTGRIHIIGGGSKTYIDKFGDVYGYESVSQGKPFGRETFNTISELLRGIWSNIIAKQLVVPIGDKKDSIRSWVESNILPGEGLTVDEIGEKYAVGNNLQFPDLSRIEKESALFSRLKSVFDVTLIKENNRYYQLNFIINKWENYIFKSTKFPSMASLSVGINIISKCKGKSSFSRSSILTSNITLTNSNTVIEDFENLIKPILKQAEKDLNKYDISNSDILSFLIEAVISGSDDSSIGLDQIADQIIAKNELNIINSVKNNDPKLWKIIEDKMGGRKANLASNLGSLGF